ncbi:MAG: Hsp33 family molecular chaperone HslO [Pseudomonadota bacterium]|nr:Hsp33 family molecular chaperone HslO [Pseudomonadota bacterium]
MDLLQRFSFSGLPIRGQWIRLDQTLKSLAQYADYPDDVKILLGEMFAAVTMVADNLKFSGAVSLQSKGDGALTRSLAECRDQHYLRGIAHVATDKAADIRSSNLADWLGNGQLALSLLPDKSTRMNPYQGLVEIDPAGLAASLEGYFQNSEQLQTRLHFASLDGTTTGLLLQRLPDAPEASEVSIAAADDDWLTLTTLAASVTTEELATLAPKQMLLRLFHEYPCELYSPRSLSFRCSCSAEKSDQTLLVLGREDLMALASEQPEIHVDCEFCGHRYVYDQAAVAKLLNHSGSALH